jgi:ribosomal protein S18 acetylase RimI-like enzyme
MAFWNGSERSSPLASDLEAKTRDLDWTLAHFAFVADVTTLAAACDIAHSPAMSVASCRTLPERALAFVGESPDLLATYAAFLADPGSEVDLLVNEDQRTIVERAFKVHDVRCHWQMVFRGAPGDIAVDQASELADNDLSSVQALSKAESFDLHLMSDDLFEHGPAYGVWDRRKLVAMGTTGICLPGLAQIDNVITRQGYRRRGYATAVVSALIRTHITKQRVVFAVVNQENEPAIRMFEKLSFVRERPMYLMHCELN